MGSSSETHDQQIPPYWLGEPVFSFKATILEIDKDWVQIHPNYLYPLSGGQLADKGKLITSIEHQILDVQKRDDIIWIQLDKIDNISVNQQVSIDIDQERRNQLSINHSAQHLLSALFFTKFNNETERSEINEVEIQIGLKQSFSISQLQEVLMQMESIIFEDRPINNIISSPDQLTKYNIRGKPKGNEVLRIVEIKNLDFNLCGGTHVSSTAEILAIHIIKIEGKKIRFCAGKHAKLMAQKDNILLLEILNLINSSKHTVIKDINQVVRSVKEIRSEFNNLAITYAKQKIHQSPWQQVGQIKYRIVDVDYLEKGQVLEAIGEPKNDEIYFVSYLNGIVLIRSNNEEIIQKIMLLLKNNGVKGGGRGVSVIARIEFSLEEFKILVDQILQLAFL
ncbi:MAG: hypothetical protein INQ03_01910 [Candidatus Heimdallarchaeota archaeon]|nr:hypothetical protein [Candidatus Heimdallarchaeota archaeon]